MSMEPPQHASFEADVEPARASPTVRPVLAKLSRPRVDRAVPRPRLFARLDALAEASVIWVTAAPGAGKTTLVGNWLAERDLRSVWYQLDADDADIATFFHYLGLAVGNARAGGAEAVLPPLMPELMPGLMRYTRQCVDRIAANVPLPAFIVLDDYERIPADAELHEVVREFASAQPPGLRMVVLSRTGPPAAFARLQLHEELVVLGGDELLLSRDEAHAVAAARRAPSAAADPARVERLIDETQGWFAGFTLLLAGDRRSGGPPGRGDSHPLLFDYFANEALRRLEPATQEALMRIALLPTMTADDAVQMSGDPGVVEVLAEMQRQNCFVSQRGHAHPEYAFHALFRSFLLDRAGACFPPDEWRALQTRAACLLALTGPVDAAAGLFRDACDWPGLSELALREAASLISSGRHRTLARWLAFLPPGFVDSQPWLRYWEGTASLPFDPVAARELFALAYAGFGVRDDVVGLYSAWAGVMETFFFEWRDFRDADHWIGEFDRLRARHPTFPSAAVERCTYWAMGTLLHRRPSHPLLPAWAARAAVLLDRSDLDRSVILGGYLTIWFLWRGETSAARDVIERIAPWIARTPSPLVHILWCCARGLYHSVRGESAHCRIAVDEGVALAAQHDLHAFDFLLHAQDARCSLIAGAVAQVDGALASMARTMRTHSHVDGAFHMMLQSYLAAQREDWRQAIDRGRGALAMAFEAGVPFLEATCRIGLAQALIGRGDRAEWPVQVTAARAIGEAMCSRVVAYLCLETEAGAALSEGRERDGIDCLARALALSQDMDGAPWLMAGPQRHAWLCHRALEAGIETAHVRRMIRQRGLAPPDPASAPPLWPWPVRVYTMGRFEVLRNDEPLRATGKTQRKPLELLKCLCAFGGHAVSQDRVTDALWPDTDGDAADQALRTTLHRLRRLLDCEAAIRIEGRSLHLDERFVHVDCLVFDRAVHLRPEIGRAGLQGAIDRYRGPFLAGESAPWALTFRQRLRAHFLGAAERLGRWHEAEGDWVAAIDCYVRAVEVEPLAEIFYRRLMDAYAHVGRRTEAIGVYRHCRQLLLTQLGISPAPETQTLYRALVDE